MTSCTSTTFAMGLECQGMMAKIFRGRN